MAMIICPKCKESKNENVSEHIDCNETVKLEQKCSCGYVHSVILERRKRYRKTTNLPGVFNYIVAGKQAAKGSITVKDISRAGICFTLLENAKQSFAVGDKLIVEFHLDNALKSLIKKDVIIKYIRGSYVGTEFCSVDLYDKALGLYMFS